MNENYYLSLLKSKTEELKNILKDIENNNYSVEYKKYLISGYIIMLDSILEIGIGDLHSPQIDELTSIIYYTRQKAVHYGYFNGMHNIDETAKLISELSDKFYESEKEYFQKIFDPSNFELKAQNLLISACPRIETDGIYCCFKSPKCNSELLIPLDKIFTLTKKCKEKVSNYIVDLDAVGHLYTKDEYKQISGLELKLFLKDNFEILEEDFTKHNKTILEIINKFISDPINSIQIMEYASNEQFCRNTIDVIKEFMYERSIFEAYLEHYHLIKDKYSLNKMQKTDYTKLQNSFKKNILQYVTQKDAFFIATTIKRAKYYFETLKWHDDSFEINNETLTPILIQLFETGPKHFSGQFISSSPEFKKCYTNLLRYRQIFSHYILNEKEYKTALNNFKSEFLSFIRILQMINLDDVRINVSENYDTYYIIERDKSDFFNYKHEQYLQIQEGIYIGKKIYYSSRNSKCDKLIAIIPGGNSTHNTTYYSRDAYGYLSPSIYIDNNTSKKTTLHVTEKDFECAKEVKIDFNFTNLFKAYNMLRKLKNNSEIQIHFPACKENDNFAHHDDLENVILRFFIQGYIPIELLRRTKLNTSKLNGGILYLEDEKGNVIANIINTKKFSFDCESHKDDKRFFSRLDDINHSYSRRRHSK